MISGIVIFLVLFIVDNFIYQINLVAYLIFIAISILLILEGQKKHE